MKPKQLWLILRAHYKAALVMFVLVAIATAALVYFLPKRYTAQASLVFDVKSVDPLQGALLPVMPGYMATQIEIIRSNRVAITVIKLLKLDEAPSVKQQWTEDTGGKGNIDDWFAERLLRGLSVAPAALSNVITVAYTSGDPAFAALVANSFARSYIDANIDLRTDPARQYARWFDEQGKSMRENLEKAQSRLSAFQQQKGIVAKDEQVDAETGILNNLTMQLTSVEGQTVEAQSKQTASADTLPEVQQSTNVQGLRSTIALKEAALQDAAGNLGKNHPQYLRMQAEIAALRKQLEVEAQKVSSGFGTSRSVSKDRERELRAAIAAQKRKVLEMKTDRDQLAVLQRDVDAAQSAYDGVVRRYNQSNLESQVTQTNVSVLNSAVEPLDPSSPNVPRIILLGLAGALLAAMGIAYLLEMLNRRVRSVEDLSDMLQLPVLAVIEPPRKQPRLPLMRPKLLTAQ
jgi:chain length determinant protein EpsF